jgi:hypothetical protein
MPMPPKPVEADGYETDHRQPPTPHRPSDPRVHEPRFSAPASEPPGPLDWLRAKGRPGPSSAADSAMVDVQDEAPLSPRPPQRPPAPTESTSEPKWSGPIRSNGAPDARPFPRGASQPEPAKQPDVHQFDSVWDRGGPQGEPSREGRPEPPLGVPRREERPPERRIEPPSRPAERTPTILKSGVIDGMPYTLYADGSIEAQLPQGLVKFASVDALRAHLEKHG